MKIARVFSYIFGLMGAIVMAGSIGLCLFSLNQEVKLTEIPAGARDCSEAVMEALASGDFSGASRLMYGQPDLGAEGMPEGQMGSMIWTAFLGSISYEFKDGCYAVDNGIARDAVVTAMDISTVTDSLGQRAHALLTARVENATDMAQLYDENNNFREELVTEVLGEAVVQALAEDAKTVARDVTLKLVYRDGQWWAVPDAALLEALSGGVA